MPGLSPVLVQKTKMAYRNAIGMQDVCNLMHDIYQQENEILELKERQERNRVPGGSRTVGCYDISV